MAKVHEFYGPYSSEMKLADMHVHTSISDGIWDVRKYLREAQKRGLSGLAITDHDNVAAGYAARELAAREFKDIEVIPGVEVSTATMHLLVYFPTDAKKVDNLPIHQSPFTTAERALKLGAWIAAPHPEHKSTASATFQEIERMVELGFNPMVELFNAGVHDVSLRKRIRGIPTTNDSTKGFYIKHEEDLGAATAGTDSHFRTMGRAMVAYKGRLEDALKNKQTSVVYTDEWEKLWPHDVLIHEFRLMSLDIWRETNFSPDTGEYTGDWG